MKNKQTNKKQNKNNNKKQQQKTKTKQKTTQWVQWNVQRSGPPSSCGGVAHTGNKILCLFCHKTSVRRIPLFTASKNQEH